MPVNPVSSLPALTGIQRGMQQVQRASAEIASAASLQSGGGGSAGVEALVDLRRGELQVAAAARALQAGSEALGRLIDTEA